MSEPVAGQTYPPAGGLEVSLRAETLPQDLVRLRTEVARGVLDGSGVVLDVSDLGRISSGAVAAILWARRTCTTRNLPFEVRGQCGVTRRVLRSCGVRDDGGGPR